MSLIDKDFILLDDKNEKMTPSQIKVLHSAISLFAERGYSGTSTSLIAENAGVSEGIIFKYYKTKKNLLNKILEIIIQQLTPVYSENIINTLYKASMNFENFVHVFVNERYHFIKSNANLFSIILSEFLTNNDLLQNLKIQLAPKLKELSIFIEKLPGSSLRISGSEVIRLIVAQLLVLFLEETKLNKPNVEQRLEYIEMNVINASCY